MNNDDNIFNSITEIGDEKICYEDFISDDDDNNNNNIISIHNIMEEFYSQNTNISVKHLLQVILSQDKNNDITSLSQNIELYCNRFYLPGYSLETSLPI